MKQALEKILEEIEKERGEENDYTTTDGKKLVRHWNTCIDVVKEIIQKYMEDATDTNTDGWVPVSERLPEKEYDTVLCVTDDDYYFVAVYTSEHMFRTGDIGADVSRIVAWCPLPELYREDK